MGNLTSETLTMLAGVALSLFFAYVPGIDSWFAGLDGVYKRGVMALALILVSLGVLAASCTGIEAVTTCDQAGVWGLVRLLMLALITNQSAYQLAVVKPEQAQ
jgi:hypothetical protein